MSFHCSACNLSVNSQEQLDQHNAGSKHKRSAAAYLNDPENRAEKLKAMATNYFVKASEKPSALTENTTNSNVIECTKSTEDPFTMDTSDSNADSSTTNCSTCRVSFTSPAQAQMHYNGAKHRQKLQMLEEMKQHDGGRTSENFCETCQVQLTSPSQAQAHYNGSKHALRLKQLEEKTQGNQGNNAEKTPLTETEGMGNEKNSITFCYTCRIQFTSPSQAKMHYQGGKHRNRIKMLEEMKSMSESTTGTEGEDEGEPSAKKPKIIQTCETCNVKLPCPESATTHYNGVKHAKKLLLLKQYDQGLCPQGFGNQNASSTAGHVFCSFCNLSINSQAQMDAHRSGSRHKANVEALARPKTNNSRPRKTVPNATSSYSGNSRPIMPRGTFSKGASSHSGRMMQHGSSSHPGRMAKQGAPYHSGPVMQQGMSSFSSHHMMPQRPSPNSVQQDMYSPRSGNMMQHPSSALFFPYGSQDEQATSYGYHEVY